MAKFSDVMDVFLKEHPDPLSTKEVAEKLGYTPTDKTKVNCSPSKLSVNFFHLIKQEKLKFSHKDERRKYYNLGDKLNPDMQEPGTEDNTNEDTTAAAEPETPETTAEPTPEPETEESEPENIPDEYAFIFDAVPTDPGVRDTLENIKEKIMQDGKITDEQEAYARELIDKM